MVQTNQLTTAFSITSWSQLIIDIILSNFCLVLVCPHSFFIWAMVHASFYLKDDEICLSFAAIFFSPMGSLAYCPCSVDFVCRDKCQVKGKTGGSVVLWETFSWHGFSSLVALEKRVNEWVMTFIICWSFSSLIGVVSSRMTMYPSAGY